MIMGTALFEEIAFRGFIFPQVYFLLKGKAQLLRAIIVSALLFSVFHIPSLVYILKLPFLDILARLFVLFIVGLISNLAYLRTGNLFVLIAIHALNNAPTPVFQTSINRSLLNGIIAFLFLVGWSYIFGNAKVTEWYSITSERES